MSTQTSARSGWTTFAGIAALIAGVYNGLSGLSTLTSDYPLIEDAHDVLFTINVDTWGWIWLLLGIAQLVTGVLLLTRNPLGRWLGIFFAGLSAMLAVFAIFAWPLWAFAVLAVDLLILYGLTVAEDFGD